MAFRPGLTRAEGDMLPEAAFLVEDLDLVTFVGTSAPCFPLAVDPLRFEVPFVFAWSTTGAASCCVGVALPDPGMESAAVSPKRDIFIMIDGVIGMRCSGMPFEPFEGGGGAGGGIDKSTGDGLSSATAWSNGVEFVEREPRG